MRGVTKPPEFKFKLYVGSMGVGKTTLANKIGGFDTDSARAAVYEPELNRLRRARNWKKHNAIWFPEIWGALWALAPTIVLDHGGWFVIELNAYAYVTEVVWLHVPLEIVLDRVAKRDGRKAELSLVQSSYEAVSDAVSKFRAIGISVTNSDETMGDIQ